MPSFRRFFLPTAVALAAALSLTGPPLAAQTDEFRLLGQILKTGEPVDSATVVLHRVSPDVAGEVDSVRVDRDGSFEFVLPSAPDVEVTSEIYFASVRYEGVLYFGSAVHETEQLDSVYVIEVYGATEAPPVGMPLPLKVRNIFLEPADEGWQVTDLMQINNPGETTIVAADSGIVWSYPLPDGARSPRVGQGDLPEDAISFEGGRVSLTAPLPPGERMLLIRYELPGVDVDIPAPGSTETFEILVKEPSPPLEVSGLAPIDVVSLEAGSTYRRYGATGVSRAVIGLVEAEGEPLPPASTVALVLTVLLAGAGLLVYFRPRPPVALSAAPAGAAGREALILEAVRLDEALEQTSDPDARQRLLDQRAALIERLRSDA